jgi:hypothetical protein
MTFDILEQDKEDEIADSPDFTTAVTGDPGKA